MEDLWLFDICVMDKGSKAFTGFDIWGNEMGFKEPWADGSFIQDIKSM